MKRKVPIIIAVFILSVGGLFILLRDNKSSLVTETTPQDKSQTEDKESDHSLESTVGGSNSFIEVLRKRQFKGEKISVENTIEDHSNFTQYLISYPSDTMKIYGVMNVPNGNGPFPVIILNHGYYNPSSFKSGDGTQNMANILASNGYLTLASDYRGHGNSENDSGRRGGHRPEYAIDVLNLIASVNSIPQADKKNIGMWGHSMGGEVSLRAIEATDKVKAVVLWAPTSGNAGDNHAFYNGNDSPTADPALEGVSPINYIKYITSPISIHQGSEDTEVNPDWSKELKEALEKQDKIVEYFEYPGEDHNFRNFGWDTISERSLNFYSKYLR